MSGDYWTCGKCGRDMDPAIKECECLKHPLAADPLTNYDPDDRHKACRGNERRIQTAYEIAHSRASEREEAAKKAEYERDLRYAEVKRLRIDSDRLKSELREQRARAEKAEDDYNNMLAATNEHTVRCFAERDQLRAELAEAKTQLIGIARERDEWRHDCENWALLKERCFEAIPGAPDDQPLDVVVADLVADLAAAQRVAG